MKTRFGLIAAAAAAAFIVNAAWAQQGTLPAQPVIIPVGTYASEVLTWVVSVFGTTIGAALTALIVKLLKNAGITANDALRAKLQEITVNGLNLAAKQVAGSLATHGTVEVKNAVVAGAVAYAQQHGADTLKALGVDPTSPEAVEAIKARIETAINDPAAPTPPVLDPPETGPVFQPQRMPSPSPT